jgi:hypothetical protein
LSNGQQSAPANGVAAEITTAEYKEASAAAPQPQPANEFSIEPTATAPDEPGAIVETSISSPGNHQQEEQPAQQQSAPFDLHSSKSADSWGFDKPSGLDPAGFKPAKFEPDGDAAKVSTSDNNEAGFHAFSSRSLFTAASVEHFHAADSTASHAAEAKSSENTLAPDLTSNPDTTDSDAADVTALLSGTSLAPAASDEIGSSDAESSESWWKSTEGSSDSDLKAALAAAEASTPTPSADLNLGAKEEPASNDEVAHEADQPADFHSVLAQLLPTSATTPAPSNSDTHSGSEWPVTEAIMGFDGEHDTQGSETSASEPGLSFETVINTSVSAEPGLALEPSTTPATADAGSSASSHRVSEAIERVLGRFKESLLSEVMRELNTK